MLSRSGSKAMRRIAVIIGLSVTVAGCSDIYWDRRESISLAAGDALAADRVIHMVDPWPASSANKNIAFNGERMQSAIERYRQGKVIPPVNATTSSVQYQQAQQAAQAATQSGAAPSAAPIPGAGPASPTT